MSAGLFLPLVGGAKAKAVDEFVDLVDVFPTIAELAGIPAPPVCADQAAADGTTV